MNWEQLDWEVLDRLRGDFLSGAAARGPYWHTLADLECYDFTYGERIGWKWDAVLRELKLCGWTLPAGAMAAGGAAGPEPVEREPSRTIHGEPGRTILDWGCGSGIAGRRVVDFFGAANFARLQVHDHSALAMDFARHRGQNSFSKLPVERASPRTLRGDDPIGVLVVSHVLNELNEAARGELAALCARAQVILWVEPGTHEVSRALGGWRERLRAQFQIIAPCPHQAACGVLAPDNARHWCHFFAAPPAGIYADSGWVKFGQRAGIDLRSLPYSFLVLDRSSPRLRPAGRLQTQSREPSGFARIIGEPRHYKGYAKIFSCEETGVAELILQKRDAPEVFKALKRADGPLVYRWSREGARITSVAPRFE